jgi:hypothetical protein
LAIDNLSFSATALGGSTGAPVISLQGLSTGPLVVSWPASVTGYHLYSATNLAPSINWTLITTPAAQTNGTFYLTILPTNAGQFFRLAAP